VFYSYVVTGFHLLHRHDAEHWGTLGSALLTLFQIVTLEGWVDGHALLGGGGNSMRFRRSNDRNAEKQAGRPYREYLPARAMPERSHPG
jgi:hypothetical protein